MDLAKGLISMVPRKTARTSGRKVPNPIHPELAARLAAVCPAGAEGPVCTLKAAQYSRDRTEVAKRFLKLFRQCGIRTSAPRAPDGARATCEVGFHSFRHAWVSRAAEDGVDPITIREVVGWTSPAMERVYTHISLGHVRAQMGKRTSLAFPSDAALPRGGGLAPDDDLGALATDEISKLANRLQAELARRGV